MAQANIDKAQAQLSQATDAYIPNLSGGSGLGYSYGFPLGQPTLFNFSSQSLVFNYSQKDYVRSARTGVDAATLALKEARQEVAEDAAVTYMSLDRIQRSGAAMQQEYNAAQTLASIVQQRLDAGLDSRLELAKARRTAAQIKVQRDKLEDDGEVLLDHLSRLIGLNGGNLRTIPESIPPLPPVGELSSTLPDTPGVLAAFATAHAKREQAFGDAKYSLRPQVFFAAQYSRFASFNNYADYYKNFTYNAAEIGVQITVPFYDRQRRSKARESIADAIHAEKEAVDTRNTVLEARVKLVHAARELQDQLDLADDEQDIAQQELDAVLLQLKTNPSDPNATPLTPKDEQNARIQERQRYIDLQQAGFELRKTEVNLLRQTGQLENWIKTAAQTQPIEAPSSTNHIQTTLPH